MFVPCPFLRVASFSRRLIALSSLPSFLPIVNSMEAFVYSPVDRCVEEAALQVAVILRVRLLPPLKSAPTRALVVNEQSAERQSRKKLRQSLSPIAKLGLTQIRSLHRGRLLGKPELRSMASGTGIAMRLHRRRRPIQSR